MKYGKKCDDGMDGRKKSSAMHKALEKKRKGKVRIDDEHDDESDEKEGEKLNKEDREVRRDRSA